MIDSIDKLKRSDIEKDILLYNDITVFVADNNILLNWVSNFKQIIYHVKHNLMQIPVCYCGKQCNFKSYTIGYRKTCSQKCSNSSAEKQVKIKQSKLERYGDENYNNISKCKKSKLERYGDENYNNRELAKETCLVKYNESHHNKNVEIYNKIKKTKFERYSNENYNNSDKIKQFYKTCSAEYLSNFTLSNKKTKFERYGDENYNNSNITIKRHFNNKSDVANLHNLQFIKFNDGAYKFKCNVCLSNFDISQTMFYLRKSKCVDICTVCNPKYQSLMQLALYNQIVGFYDKDILLDDRSVLCSLEIDIYLPDIKLGIEFNGVYWHSDEYKDELYHYNKKKEALSIGIDLVFVWEDDWISNKDKILDRLKNIIKIKTTNDVIYFEEKLSADWYISEYGIISEWYLPISNKRNGYDVYDSGVISIKPIC